MEPEEKIKLDEFLNNVGLRRNTKLSVQHVKVLKIYPNTQAEKDDTVFQFFTQLAANDRQVIQNLSASSKHRARKSFPHISRRDVLFAILNCCDPSLLQDVCFKLHKLGNAVPMLMPSVDDDNVHFLHWGLWPCFQHRAVLDGEYSLSTYDFLSVSAFRFGDLDFSKSEILNNVLAKLQNVDEPTCYTSYLDDPEETVWSKGTLEVTWHTCYQQQNMSSTPSFLLLNLRGDGLKYTRQRSFCRCFSQIQVVFLSRQSDEVFKELYTMSETSQVIVLTENANSEKIEKLPEETVTVIKCKGLSSQERTKALLQSLIEKLETPQKRLKCSMQDISVASEKLSFVDDQKQFHKAVRLANGVDYYISRNFYDCKGRMPLFTKFCKGFDSLRDLIVSESFCQQNLEKYQHVSLPKHLERLLRFFTLNGNEQQVFLTFLHLCLEQKCCQRIEPYMDMYKAHFEGVNSFYKSNKGTECWRAPRLNAENVCSSEKALLQSLNRNALSVEHYMRAMWQLLRSSHPQTKKWFDNDAYNECIKTWLLSGNSVELINFDSCHMPSAWAETVLAALQSLLKDVSVRVLCAFGGNESNTSLLLNHMFGANFTQIENMCPGGLRMQLIPIQQTAETLLGFHYLLLLNMKMVSLAETIQGSYLEMRGFVLTVMSSITDVLLVDIDKEEPEESIIFDMIAHGVLKNACSVVDKCCIIYRVMDTKSTTLSDLQKYTSWLIKQSSSKIAETEIGSPAQTDTEESDLNKKIKDIISVKVLPRLQNSLSSNQDYVKGLCEFKSFILQLLKQCRREACDFTKIGERITSQTTKALEEANSSLQTRFYKFVHDPTRIRQYLLDNVETTKQKISRKLLSASKTIVKADDVQKAHNRALNEIQKFISDEIGKLRTYFVSVGEIEKSLSHESNVETFHLLEQKEQELNRSIPIQLEQAIKVARENAVKIKVNELLATMMNVQEGDRSNSSTEEFKEGPINKYLIDISNEYPETTISQIKSRVNQSITDELKKTKYGNHVQTLTNTTVLADWCAPLESLKSTEDVQKLEKQFNYADKRAEQVLLECKKRLHELSGDYSRFTTISEKVVALLKEYLRFFQITVDSLTMCIFLCIKFVSSIHKNHVRADIQNTAISENEIDFETYKIKHVEPLHLPSLESKLDYIVTLFETLFTGDDLSYLTKAFQLKNVINYDHIPFNILTLQRLDRHLFLFLPVMSSEDVSTILQTVTDAKLYCLGVTLARSSYDIDESCQHVFEMTEALHINARDSQSIKAAIFVHVCAWSSALISAKEYQNESTRNVAYRVRKLVPILKLGIKIFLKQTIEEEFAKIVCDVVEDSLLNCIPQEFQTRLRELILQTKSILFLKRSFIGQMLHLFCIKDDFQQLILFLENYDHCSQKWILVYLVTIINDRNESLIWKLKNDVIEEKIASVIQAVKQSTSHCVKSSNSSLYSWLKTFGTYLVDVNDDTFKYLDKRIQFNDFNVFSDHLCDILNNMKNRINKRIEIPERGNVDSTKTFLFSLSRDMHEELSNKIKGCVEQCPLCGNVCELSISNHKNHSVQYHLPVGMKGRRDKESDELMSLICPNLVTLSKLDGDNDDDEISKPSTMFETTTHIWHEGTTDPCVFWKYTFNRFNRQFADYYECREGRLPSAWKDYSKEDAIRSVELTYNLKQN